MASVFNEVYAVVVVVVVLVVVVVVVLVVVDVVVGDNVPVAVVVMHEMMKH